MTGVFLPQRPTPDQHKHGKHFSQHICTGAAAETPGRGSGSAVRTAQPAAAAKTVRLQRFAKSLQADLGLSDAR